MQDSLLLKRAAILSAAAHVAVAAYAFWGRWLFRDTTPPEPFVSVELVDIATLTQARQRPVMTPVEPKPEPPEPAEPAPEPEPEPQPQETPPAPTPDLSESLPPPEESTPEVPELVAEPELPEPTPEPVEPGAKEKESRDDEATIPDDDIPLALPKPKPAYKPSKRSTKALSSILKNLIPKPTAALPTEEPAKDKKSATPSKPGHAAHRLSDRDTVRLQDAIRQQLMPCWNPPAGAKDARNLVVSVDVHLSKEGMITKADIVPDARLSDPFFRAAAESARRAARNPRCQPLKLPAEHYDAWRAVVLTFDPKNF